jgi:butyrate kinase
MPNLIIAINPGSTSTKIAVYEESKCLFEENIKHSAEDLAPFEKITDQFEFRKAAIMERLNRLNIKKEDIKVVMGRGGMVKPIESGVYRIKPEPSEYQKGGYQGRHGPRRDGKADRVGRVPDQRGHQT